MEDDDKPIKPKLIILGRDVSEIPCFRNSFLYGISGGLVVGVLTFLGTSRVQLSSRVGFGTFFIGTLTYWSWCRYQWAAREIEYGLLREAIREQAITEGTDVEKKLDLKTV